MSNADDHSSASKGARLKAAAVRRAMLMRSNMSSRFLTSSRVSSSQPSDDLGDSAAGAGNDVNALRNREASAMLTKLLAQASSSSPESPSKSSAGSSNRPRLSPSLSTRRSYSATRSSDALLSSIPIITSTHSASYAGTMAPSSSLLAAAAGASRRSSASSEQSSLPLDRQLPTEFPKAIGELRMLPADSNEELLESIMSQCFAKQGEEIVAWTRAVKLDSKEESPGGAAAAGGNYLSPVSSSSSTSESSGSTISARLRTPMKRRREKSHAPAVAGGGGGGGSSNASSSSMKECVLCLTEKRGGRMRVQHVSYKFKKAKFVSRDHWRLDALERFDSDDSPLGIGAGGHGLFLSFGRQQTRWLLRSVSERAEFMLQLHTQCKENLVPAVTNADLLELQLLSAAQSSADSTTAAAAMAAALATIDEEQSMAGSSLLSLAKSAAAGAGIAGGDAAAGAGRQQQQNALLSADEEEELIAMLQSSEIGVEDVGQLTAALERRLIELEGEAVHAALQLSSPAVPTKKAAVDMVGNGVDADADNEEQKRPLSGDKKDVSTLVLCTADQVDSMWTWLNEYNQRLNDMQSYLAEIERRNNHMEITERNLKRLHEHVEQLLEALRLDDDAVARLQSPDLRDKRGVAEAAEAADELGRILLELRGFEPWHFELRAVRERLAELGGLRDSFVELVVRRATDVISNRAELCLAAKRPRMTWRSHADLRSALLQLAPVVGWLRAGDPTSFSAVVTRYRQRVGHLLARELKQLFADIRQSLAKNRIDRRLGAKSLEGTAAPADHDDEGSHDSSPTSTASTVAAHATLDSVSASSSGGPATDQPSKMSARKAAAFALTTSIDAVLSERKFCAELFQWRADLFVTLARQEAAAKQAARATAAKQQPGPMTSSAPPSSRGAVSPMLGSGKSGAGVPNAFSARTSAATRQVPTRFKRLQMQQAGMSPVTSAAAAEAESSLRALRSKQKEESEVQRMQQLATSSGPPMASTASALSPGSAVSTGTETAHIVDEKLAGAVATEVEELETLLRSLFDGLAGELVSLVEVCDSRDPFDTFAILCRTAAGAKMHSLIREKGASEAGGDGDDPPPWQHSAFVLEFLGAVERAAVQLANRFIDEQVDVIKSANFGPGKKWGLLSTFERFPLFVDGLERVLAHELSTVTNVKKSSKVHGEQDEGDGLFPDLALLTGLQRQVYEFLVSCPDHAAKTSAIMANFEDVIEELEKEHGDEYDFMTNVEAVAEIDKSIKKWKLSEKFEATSIETGKEKKQITDEDEGGIDEGTESSSKSLLLESSVLGDLVRRSYHKMAVALLGWLDNLGKIGQSEEGKAKFLIRAENLHYFVKEARLRPDVSALEEHVQRADRAYEENIEAYSRHLMRKHFGVLVEFFNGVKRLLDSGLPANEIAFQSAYSAQTLSRAQAKMTPLLAQKALLKIRKSFGQNVSQVDLRERMWTEVTRFMAHEVADYEAVTSRCYEKVRLSINAEQFLQLIEQAMKIEPLK